LLSGLTPDAAAVRCYRKLKDERVWISDDGHTLRFRGTPTSDVDGFKIRVEDADKVDLDLKWDGGSAPTDHIWIGRDDEHPDGSSFTLRV
jgi:hypothetical protein